MTDNPLTKSSLRKATLARRNAMALDRRIEGSLVASDHALSSPWFSSDAFMPGTVVAGYHPINSEMDPRPLMAELASLGARLCLPVVTGKTSMEFRELVRGAPMEDSGFGTIGPDKSAQIVDPDVLLMPLACYDDKGGRVGYGAGFYDRAIAELKSLDHAPLLLGMAFSCQRVESVPVEPHDQPLAAIFTEQGVVTA